MPSVPVEEVALATMHDPAVPTSGRAVAGGETSPGDRGRDGARAIGLVGREHERELLAAALEAPPGLVLVTGAGGVGKSALVREVLAAARPRGAAAIVGRCHRMREPFPLGPVLEALCGLAGRAPREALSPVAGALQPLLPELARLLPPRPAPLGDAQAERHRIFRALRELLGAFGPLVCVLEDLHWADESTLELLEFLACEPPPEAVVVVTYRADELPPTSSLPALAAALPERANATTIRLPPLSVAHVRELSAALLGGHGISDELARHLHELTGGLPFALEEVVRLHGAQLGLVDGWRTVAELDGLGVPPAVRQALSARMAALPHDARLAARAAAVLGAPSDERLIGRVADLSPARAVRALGDALAAAVLEEREGGRYGFLHALAAQAVYEQIPGPERRWLHRRAGEALQALGGTPPLAQLARHFREAGDERRWADHAEAAADAATAIGDDRAAARLLEQALGASGLPLAARLRMAVKLGRAALYSATPERALELLDRIRDEEPIPAAVRGELRYRSARLRYQIGDPGAWREELERAVEELADRPDLAAYALVTLASPVVGQGPVEDDLAWLRRALEAAARADDRAVAITVAAQRAAILLCIGDPEGWRAVQEIPAQAETVAERLALMRANQSLAGMAAGPGHFERGARFLARAEQLARELPHVRWQPWLDSARATLDWRRGHWDGLEPRLRALAGRGSGGPGLAISNELLLAALLLARGRVRDAEESLRSIRDRAVTRGWMGAQIGSAAGLARILLARGDAAAAAEAAAAGIAVLERKRIWIWGRELAPVAVRALLAAGEREAAVDLARRFSAGVEGRDAPAAHAAAAFCDGLLVDAAGEPARAAARFAESAALSAQLPAPYEAARARAEQGRCLLAAGRRRGAEVLLAALHAFDELGASWEATRIRAQSRTHDIVLPARRRGGRRSYGDELSPREAEVAQLAGEGHKNREIAETLFISQRTVETHVAAALRKLGAASREELAEALAGRTSDRSVAATKNP